MSKIRWNHRARLLTGEIISLLLAIALAGCAAVSTATPEPRNKVLSAGSARIYFLRLASWSYSLVSTDIKVNGANIGALGNNSYLFVDRPPGRYTINVRAGRLPAAQYNVRVKAGRKYYFVINMRPMGVPIQNGLTFITVPEPAMGKSVPGQNSAAFAHLAELDAKTGAAMISKLDAQ